MEPKHHWQHSSVLRRRPLDNLACREIPKTCHHRVTDHADHPQAPAFRLRGMLLQKEPPAVNLVFVRRSSAGGLRAPTPSIS